MNKNKLSVLSRVLLVAAAICLVISLFVPVWIIYLDAPQYPEGLALQIWAGRLAGDVDIINGLNHYIGMKTLHANDFIEFTVLPYIIAVFALLFLAAAIAAKKKWLYVALGAFVVFGIVAMADFWKWEYDYGHNLDPNAAIKVPGMAYQPPLIGFKQLLNFGAYSVPDIGGWLFIAAGILLAIAVFLEVRSGRQPVEKMVLTSILPVVVLVSSCGSAGPRPIDYNKDACDFCKMSISESRFAAELVTAKGRVYKFDDLACLLSYTRANKEVAMKNFYTGNFLEDQRLIDATGAFFVKHESVHSPMGGNIAAFATQEAAAAYAGEKQAHVLGWKDLEGAASMEPTHEHSH